MQKKETNKIDNFLLIDCLYTAGIHYLKQTRKKERVLLSTYLAA